MSTFRVVAKSKVPPGLIPTVKATVSNLLPAALVVATARILSARGLKIGTVWVTLVALLSLPVVYIGRKVYRNWSFKRRAAAMGAVMPPTRVGKRIGNMDILQKSMDAFNNNGWLGMCTRVVGFGRAVLTLAPR